MMTLSAAVIDALVAAGATVEQLAAAVKADLAEKESQEAARLEAKRAGNAERQARFRAARKAEGDNASNALQAVTERDSVTHPPSLDKSPPDPQKLIPTPHTHTGDASAREATPKLWACPDGVEPAHWRDFRANRRRKKLTDSETAYLGQLRLLERFADDEWPPGRLVQHAAEKGWGTIVDPSEFETPRNGQRHHNPRTGGSRNGLFDASVRWALGEPDPGHDERTIAHR